MQRDGYLNMLTTYGDNLCFRQCDSEREFNLDQSLLLQENKGKYCCVIDLFLTGLSHGIRLFKNMCQP